MKNRKLMWAGILMPALGAGVVARDVPPAFLGEAVTGAQVPGGATGATAATAAAGAAGKESALCKLAECLRQCKEKMCQKPCGKMINGMLKPLSLMTGGMLGNFCPDRLSDKTIEEMKPGAEKTAAEVQAAEAGAGERRAAIRYLATADCHWYPDVAEQLGGALRKDTVECVRLEAASALLTGCCCNKTTIKALKNAITCEPDDVFPKETSGRVQWVAFQALNKCLACYVERPDTKKDDKPKKATPKDTGSAKGGMTSTDGMVPQRSNVQAASYGRKAADQSMAELVAEARMALREYEARHQGVNSSSTNNERSLAQAWTRAYGTPTLKPIAMERTSAPTQVVASKPGETRVVISETIVPKNGAWSNSTTYAAAKPTYIESKPAYSAPVQPAASKPVTVTAKPVVQSTTTVVESNPEPAKRSLYSMMFQGRSNRSKSVVIESAPVRSYATTTAPKAPVNAVKPLPAVSTSAKPAYTYPAASVAAQPTWKTGVVPQQASKSNAYSRPAQLARPTTTNVQQAANVKPVYQPVEVIESATYSEPAGAPLPQAGANYPRGL